MANYFAIFLVSMTAITGIIWLIDALLFAPTRKEVALQERRTILGDSTIAELKGEEADPNLPVLVDNAKQFFPIFALVMVFRSFLYEPFQIPSGSMMPTLLVGDFILVEKFSYGIKDPIFRHKIIETGKPDRGDVAVFKFPADPNIDYIKRVVGLPGDRIVYRNKQLYITEACNGREPCPQQQAVSQIYSERTEFVSRGAYLEQYTEDLGSIEHSILRNPRVIDLTARYEPRQPGTAINEWLVPQGSYFLMGDNRDNSEDGRYWGFVPEANLVGQAVLIWVSFEFERVPEDFLPTWLPSGIRFERSGGIS